MKLENIDTSTTEGKIEVMRLASEGRRVAIKAYKVGEWKFAVSQIWDWLSCDYAIIAEPVGPKELWAVITSTETDCNREWAEQRAKMWGGTAVRYIRADD